MAKLWLAKNIGGSLRLLTDNLKAITKEYIPPNNFFFTYLFGQNKGIEDIETLDSSGKGNNGTVSNTDYNYANNGIIAHYDQIGHSGSATDEYIIVDNGDTMDFSNGFSISFWELNAGSSVRYYLRNGASGDDEFAMYKDNSGMVSAWVRNVDKSGYRGRSTGAGVATGRWARWTFQWNGGIDSADVTLKRNGVQVDTTNFQGGSFTALNSAAGPLTFMGRYNDIYNHRGSMALIKATTDIWTNTEDLALLDEEKPLIGVASQASYDLGLNSSKVLDVTFSGTHTNNAQDGSSYHHSISESNTSDVDLGVSNGAGSFNGTNSLVTVTNDDSLHPRTSDYVVSLWVKNGDLGSNRPEIFEAQGTDIVQLWADGIDGADGALKWAVKSGNTATASTPLPIIEDGIWHHILCEWKASTDTASLYIDTILKATDTATITDINPNVDFLIGGGNNGYYDGSIDEFKIYKGTTLSPTTISALYQEESVLFGNISGIWNYSWYDNLVGFWTFNDGTSKDWSNLGVGGLSSTDTSVTYSIADGDATFNGSSSKIDAPLNISSSLSHTISLWANPNDTDGALVYYGCGMGNGTALKSALRLGGTFSSGNDATQAVGWFGTSAGVSTVANTWTDVKRVGKWSHVAIVIDIGEQVGTDDIAIYIDGVKQTLTADIELATITNIDNLKIGVRADNNWWFDGKLDNVMILDTALSASQIQTDLFDAQKSTFGYLAGWDDETFAGNTSGLYTFNRDSSQDYSGNNVHGTDTAITYSDGVASFNGTISNIRIGGTTLLNGLTEITYSCWAKWDGTMPVNGAKAFFATRGSQYNAINFTYASNEGINIWVNTNKLIDTDGIYAVPVGEWIHVVGTWKSGENAKLYINGELHTTGSSYTGSISQNDYYYIGWDDFYGHTFDGEMDNCAIFDRALNETEIQTLYNDYPHERFVAGQ